METTAHTPAPTTLDADRVRPGVRAWLGWFALSVVIGMQAGTVFKPLGEVGVTRVADWVDLMTPYAVLGTAALVLLRAGANRAQWVWFGVGGVTFALGKGLHISANSVSNVADAVVAHASVVHLWDEVVSHLIWYSGLFIVIVVIGWTLQATSFRVGVVDLAVAGLVAITLVNTYIEGGQPLLGTVFLAALTVLALRWRPAPVARLLLVVGGIGLVLLLGWGAYWFLVDGSFYPQFSELGWI